MKTPEEIKKGLRTCATDDCKRCNYKEECDLTDGFSVLAWDALKRIEQLENLETERKALIYVAESGEGLCATCEYSVEGNPIADKCEEADYVCLDCKYQDTCPCIICEKTHGAEGYEWNGRTS